MSDLNAFLAEESGGNESLPNDNAPVVEEQAPASEPQETPPPAPTATEEQPPEGLDDRGQAIWREERNKRKELQKQVDQMNERWMELVGRMQQPPAQQPPQPNAAEIEVPDFEDDPIGHLRAKNEILERQLQEVNQERTVRQTQTQQVQQFQQLQAGVDQLERTFAASTPDYHEAVGHMYGEVARMANAMGYSPQQVQQTISQMALDISMRALQQGRNPAQVAYEAARALGYSGPKPTQPPEGEQAHTPQPPTSLSGVAGKRTSAGTPTWDAIAKMDDTEFEKLWAQMEKDARH
jgi:hypothetical protein